MCFTGFTVTYLNQPPCCGPFFRIAPTNHKKQPHPGSVLLWWDNKKNYAQNYSSSGSWACKQAGRQEKEQDGDLNRRVARSHTARRGAAKA